MQTLATTLLLPWFMLGCPCLSLRLPLIPFHIDLLCRATHAHFLEAAGCTRTTALLNPDDHMNVMAVADLSTALSAVALLDPATFQSVGQLRQWQATCLLAELFRCLWSIFDVEASLASQLTDLSKLAHLLAYLYAGTGARTKFLPAQLYHDMQAMVKNAFFCVAKVSFMRCVLAVMHNIKCMHLSAPDPASNTNPPPLPTAQTSTGHATVPGAQCVPVPAR